MNQQADIRNQLKAKRRELNKDQQRDASQRVANLVRELDYYQAAKHIALYYPCNGEMGTAAILDLAERQMRYTYLPVIQPAMRQLFFARYRRGETLQDNQYNIPEPVASASNMLAAEDLDLVFVPLVGFDRQGHRIGMGAGFYDRTFSFRKQMETPRLIGLAHSIQEVASIEANPWDIPLDAVVTEKEVLVF